MGTRELNKVLQSYLNPQGNGKDEKKSGNIIYRVGDRVMQIKNNYDMTWEKDKEIGTGIFNGEIGTITEIDEKEKVVEVQFDDEKICWYEYSDLDQIEHSYAITIHKAQGSEFDVVIMASSCNQHQCYLQEIYLYTGITRAKKLLIIIGSERVVNYMIQNVDSKKRNTGLEYKLRKLAGE